MVFLHLFPSIIHAYYEKINPPSRKSRVKARTFFKPRRKKEKMRSFDYAFYNFTYSKYCETV